MEDSNLLCEECGIYMEILDFEVVCKKCGQMQPRAPDDANHDNIIRSGLRVHRANRPGGSWYNIHTNHYAEQRQSITDFLISKRHNFHGNMIPKTILEQSANQYVDIQIATNGEFVKRGETKNEILAAIIYYECKREKLDRKRAEIAKFMELKHDGFATGQNILIHQLAVKGLYTPPDDSTPWNGYSTRYLDALNITNDSIFDAINDIVERSEIEKIGIKSQISSKVAGCIMYFKQLKIINATDSEIEIACDNIKKNTFIKFTNEIKKFPNIFQPILTQHNLI